MRFDYSKLNGRIVEICGTQTEFADKLQMSRPSVNCRIKNKQAWSQQEMIEVVKILRLDTADIPVYFFTPEVQNF